jgi:hypothetical protein
VTTYAAVAGVASLLLLLLLLLVAVLAWRRRRRRKPPPTEFTPAELAVRPASPRGESGAKSGIAGASKGSSDEERSGVAMTALTA